MRRTAPFLIQRRALFPRQDYAICVKLFVGLQQIQVYKKLAWLNALPTDEAERVFRECCGSAAWARSMAGSRPFPMLEPLFTRAEAIWLSLPLAEKIDAFPLGTAITDLDRWRVIESRLTKLLER